MNTTIKELIKKHRDTMIKSREQCIIAVQFEPAEEE